MKLGFIYMWYDSSRKMFYLGSHDGTPTDGYLSSSYWLNGEIMFRPSDFRRKILKTVPLEQLRKEEHRLLKMIKPGEHGKRYYNAKQGTPKGTKPWNNGITTPEWIRQKISASRKGQPAWNKGKSNPTASDNGKKSALKLSKTAKGRKMVIVDGKRKWAYSQNDSWFVMKNGAKVLLDFAP